MGISIGTDGLLFNASASGGKGKADGTDTVYTNTQVKAGQQVTITSGGDTTLQGAVVKAELVKADVGGNLNIASLQDTSTYTSEQKSMGGSVSVGFGKMSGSFSASNSNINSNFNSVGEQSGIKAGDGGFRVNVGGNTSLNGSVIASTDKAVTEGKNSFSTGGTLNISDIQNSASYDAKSVGISVGSGQQPIGKLDLSGLGIGIGSDKGNASSTSSAGISGIAGNTAVRSTDAETGLKPIFDATKVQAEINAQMQITQAFTKEAPKAVASFAASKYNELKDTNPVEAAKWAEGGVYRIALHTVVGALGGGLDGAAGAAVSASSANLMDALQDGILQGLVAAGLSDSTAKALAQTVATLTAAGVGAAVGGGQGAATAATVDANNRQLHPSEIKWIADNRKAFAEKLSKELGRPVSELEAMYWLTAAGESNVDAGMQRSNAQFVRGTSNTEDSQSYDIAKAFIAGNTKTNSSFVDERGQTQNLFSAQNGEFYKPEVYSQWRNNAGYRDYYWNVMGINLKGDSLSPQEQALYDQRQQVVNAQTAKQLALLTVQAAAAKIASNVAAKSGEPGTGSPAKLTAEEAAVIERARIENNINADLPNVYANQNGGKPLGRSVATYDMVNHVGPLPVGLAGTFSAGRYVEVVTTQDTVLYRAGTKDVPLGQFFSTDVPSGVIQSRIDKAILPLWPEGGTSPIDSVFAVKIPAGTRIYVGETSVQNGFYVGGTEQIVVPTPWKIPGVESKLLGPLK